MLKLASHPNRLNLPNSFSTCSSNLSPCSPSSASLPPSPTRSPLVSLTSSTNTQLINKCGQGTPKWKQGTGPLQDSTTVNGPIKGGLAFMTGGNFGCVAPDSVNCNDVEFTLINKETDPNNRDCAINYSLISAGGHDQFKYKVEAHYAGGSGCSGGPGPCNSYNDCPYAWRGGAGDPNQHGNQYECQGDDVGVSVFQRLGLTCRS